MKRLVFFVPGFVLTCNVAAVPFIRGDANQDGSVDVSDGIGILLYLFLEEPMTCEDALDTNDSGNVDLADPVALFLYLFANGPAPAIPYPDCGNDSPSEDALDCVAFDPTICPALPEGCLVEGDVADVVDAYLGQPLCIASPAYEGSMEILGTPVPITACPVGCCTCTSGEEGCEATIDDLEVTIDFTTRSMSATYTASAEDIVVIFGEATCSVDLALVGWADGTFTLKPTQWENVYTFGRVNMLIFTVENLSIEGSGAFVCRFLNAGADELRAEIEQVLNDGAADFMVAIEEELADSYICP